MAGFRHAAAANQCTDCHSPHASGQRYILKGAVPDLCSKCHEKIFSDQKKLAAKHSPVTEPPACMNCHDPHTAPDRRLLLEEEAAVCVKCHDGSTRAGQNKLANIKQLLAANPAHHGPIQSRECSGCHEPHSSAYFRLLTRDYPKDFYTPYRDSAYDLCFRCHDPALMKESGAPTPTGFRDGDRNLHFVHVGKPPRGRTCLSCHEAHASALPKYMRASVLYGKWNLPIGFKETENGGSCEPGCHSAKKYERLAMHADRK
jgi:predicted CXXCH cytochrome family protein